MDYYEWSMEYRQSADRLLEVINRLKKSCKRASKSERKELDSKLHFYRQCYRECLDTAQHLRKRHEGAA